MVLNRILYVEDEPDLRTLAKLALETLGGFTVELCASGDEAIARAPGFRPDLILLDVVMPGMDGRETLAVLRATAGLSETPVVFMTAKNREEDIAQFRALGAVGFIPKPFDPMTLSATVRQIWDGLHA